MTTLHRLRRVGATLLVCFSMLLATSCSSGKLGSVSGKITVNGKPIARGLITFLPQGEKNDPASAAIIDGVYDTGMTIPAGLCKIYIIPSSSKPQEAAGGNDLVPRPKTPAGRDPNAVPTKFQNADTSGLTVTVKSGEAITFDKDLTP